MAQLQVTSLDKIATALMCNKNWDTSFRIMNKRFAYICLHQISSVWDHLYYFIPKHPIVLIASLFLVKTLCTALILFSGPELEAGQKLRHKPCNPPHVCCMSTWQAAPEDFEVPGLRPYGKNSRNPIKGMTWKSRGGSMLENVANTNSK